MNFFVEHLNCDNFSMVGTSSSNVNNTTIINMCDPELTRAFREIMCNQDIDSAERSLALEFQEDMAQLEKNQQDDVKSKSILAKLSEKLNKAKQLGDSIAGVWPYIKTVYNLVQPFAAQHGFPLPTLPPTV